MKIGFLFSVFFLIVSTAFSQLLKMGIISDVHYLSEQLMDKGAAINNYTLSSGKNVSDVPAVLDQVIADYLKSDIEVLLISGDMTKDGERQSHLDFVKKLNPLIDKGIRVFVVPGNHDINMPNSIGYKGDTTYPVVTVSPDDFSNIYSDCGYSSAIKRDTASLSYVAELCSDTWLLAIDGCLYKKHKEKSISSGRISIDTELWIIETLREAKDKNIRVVSMIHHGLVEYFPFQSRFFSDYIVDDWYRIASLLADYDVKFIFTGHFHATDITAFTSDEGNTIYDIETGSLSSYPYPYRFAELSKEGLNISTKSVMSTPQNPNLFEEGKERLKQQAYKVAQSKVLNRYSEISPATLAHLAEVVSDVFILHVEGDEFIDDSLRNKIEIISSEMDMPIDVSSESLQFDFPPADKNVRLSF